MAQMRYTLTGLPLLLLACLKLCRFVDPAAAQSDATDRFRPARPVPAPPPCRGLRIGCCA
eukprot:6179952-Pleurochrysis_carterae.AAC.3